MSTIPETMKDISVHIQQTFHELVKLLLKKSVHPALNPISNCHMVHNKFKNRFERGNAKVSNDNTNKYTYTITSESLGWIDEILANIKLVSKGTKSKQSKYEKCYKVSNTPEKSSNVSHINQYQNFLKYITSKATVGDYTSEPKSCNIPYTVAFKQLEMIGQDIIDQTDPSINGCASAKMSTASIRIKLYNLEQLLAKFSMDYPAIFDSYIEMITLINELPQTKISWVISLIATVSYQDWKDIDECKRKSLNDALGEEFISDFLSNQMITILLQSDPEMILKSSYLFPLMKMLFVVFGFSKLVPIIVEDREEINPHVPKINRYKGATFRRGDVHDFIPIEEQDNREELPPPEYVHRPEYYSSSDAPNTSKCCVMSNYNTKPKYQDISVDYQNLPSLPKIPTSSIKTRTTHYRGPSLPINSKTPDYDPVDPEIYEFIRLFGDLYPTIIGLMGGTQTFPPEDIIISSKDIPSTFFTLSAIPEYLWRFNDYSYCKYLDYVDSKQIQIAINSKINARIKYLKTV